MKMEDYEILTAEDFCVLLGWRRILRREETGGRYNMPWTPAMDQCWGFMLNVGVLQVDPEDWRELKSGQWLPRKLHDSIFTLEENCKEVGKDDNSELFQ